MRRIIYVLYLGEFLAMLSNQISFAESLNHGVLVDIKAVNPTIIVDLRYATANNFTKHTIYDSAVCLLHKDAAFALNTIQQELARRQLGLKIWDGYRSLIAQKKLWSICPDANYVCPPEKGGRHTRGTAVDVTLVDLKTHKELAMPTEFDDFTPKAWITNDDLSQEVKRNRDLLQTVMKKHGFEPIETEWWHFDLKGWKHYSVLN